MLILIGQFYTIRSRLSQETKILHLMLKSHHKSHGKEHPRLDTSNHNLKQITALLVIARVLTFYGFANRLPQSSFFRATCVRNLMNVHRAVVAGKMWAFHLKEQLLSL